MKTHLKHLLAILLLTVVSPANASDHEDYQRSLFPDHALRLDVGLGHIDVDTSDGDDASGEKISGEASFAFNVLGKHVQLDSHIEYLDFDGSLTSWGFAGHFGHRDESRGYIALNPALSHIKTSDVVSAKFYRIGLEGEYFFDRFTIGASGGAIHAIAEDDEETDTGNFYYFKALARYYFTDDFKLEGSYGLLDPEGSEGELDLAHILVEYALADRPMSVYGRWNGTFVDAGEGDEVDVNEFIVGLRFYLGGSRNESIKTTDRRYFTDSCVFDSLEGIC